MILQKTFAQSKILCTFFSFLFFRFSFKFHKLAYRSYFFFTINEFKFWRNLIHKLNSILCLTIVDVDQFSRESCCAVMYGLFDCFHYYFCVYWQVAKKTQTNSIFYNNNNNNYGGHFNDKNLVELIFMSSVKYAHQIYIWPFSF